MNNQFEHTIFSWVLVKCPTHFKIRLICDYGYDIESQYCLTEKVIPVLNNNKTVSLHEKKKIISFIMKNTEIKRQIEFIKIWETIKKRIGNKSIGCLTAGMVK